MHHDTDAYFRLDPFVTDAAAPPVTAGEIRAFHEWTDRGGDGEGLTLAVVDSGVDESHPVFEDVPVTHESFVESDGRDSVGHGTAVAGLAVELAPAVEEVIDLRVFGGQGRGSLDPIADAYEWLVDNADRVDVMNASIGSNERVSQLDVLHNRMVAAGVLGVVSAGNSGGLGGSPATAERAFSAGAVTIEGELTRFSAYNPERDNPDVSAVGKDVRLPRAEGTSLGQVIDDRYVKASGTSFSAPILSAAVLQYLSAEFGEVVRTFEGSARELPDTPREGCGILDVAGAFDLAAGHDGEGGDEDSSTGVEREATAEVVDVEGGDVVVLDTDWLEAGTHRVGIEGRTLTIRADDGEGAGEEGDGEV
ncbi:S8 family serine peptidase [Salinirubellus sp. GCM10025818]|uniref:S8 family peptidase n=1 Tax=Salinirubellus TaxID=2162630 RepID=UPI0030D55313